MNNLKIAFIAKYAPPIGSKNPVPAIDENAVYAQYHYDIYSTLINVYPNLLTGNNAQFILEHHNEIDYIFSLLNRAPYRNSEIFISSLAEYYGIPYLGARPNIRALAEDKHLAKIMAEHCGIITPKWITINVGEDFPAKAPFDGKYFVKPRFGASSMFIDVDSICETWSDVKKQVSSLFLKGEDVIIEEFVDGMYYSSPVIVKNGMAIVLPPVREESNLKGNVVTYRQKRKVDGGLLRRVETSQSIIKAIENSSKRIADFIRPVDYLRIDYIINSSGVHFIEFNVCCNLGKQSAFVLSAKSAGFTYEKLIHSVLLESLKRQNIKR